MSLLKARLCLMSNDVGKGSKQALKSDLLRDRSLRMAPTACAIVLAVINQGSIPDPSRGAGCSWGRCGYRMDPCQNQGTGHVAFF